MYKNVWNKCQSSVCLLNFYSSLDIKLLTMTGFKVKEHFLLTDENIFKINKAVKVRIVFVKPDGHSESKSVEISMEELKLRMIKGIDKKETGFVAIRIDFEEFEEIPSLKLSEIENVSIGQNIAVLGYQLDHNNLSIKTGIISSTLIHENGLKYLQVESNLNQGNSGSPVINSETGEIIGIIGQNLASIAQSHKRMKQIINNNLAILKKSQGKFNVEEIDPIQVLIANQNQIKFITNEIYKNATMSMGYAINTSYVHAFFEEFIDAEFSHS